MTHAPLAAPSFHGVLVLCGSLLLSACGKPPSNPPPDAGVDSSCGLDCELQARFGLIVGRCFEYSDTRQALGLPALGVEVTGVRELEGGLKVISVDYSQSGARRLKDNFFFQAGELRLARREFVTGGTSVSYLDENNTLTGVTWWEPGTTAGESFETQTQARVGTTVTPTTYGVITAMATADEQTVPAGTYDTGVTMVFDEQPSHGSDTRRVFVDGVGFTLIASSLSASGTNATVYRLQGIRDLGTPDAGTNACGFGQ